MIKLVLWVALLAAQVAPPSVPRAKAENATQAERNNKEQKSAEKPPAAPAVQCADCFNVEQPTSKNERKNTESRFSKNLYTGYLIATIVGVGAALVGLFFIYKQMKIAGKAADAALQSAKYIINSERPWLLIPLGDEYSEIQDPVLIARLPGEVRVSYCTFIMKNFGRSPAKVVEMKLGLFTSTDFNFVPDAHVFDAQGSLADDYTFPQGTTAPVQATFMPDGWITPQEKEEIEVKKKRYLWLCGYLKYRDTFDRNEAPVYETRICYRWVNYTNSPKPFWMLVGPAEYNRAT